MPQPAALPAGAAAGAGKAPRPRGPLPRAPPRGLRAASSAAGLLRTTAPRRRRLRRRRRCRRRCRRRYRRRCHRRRGCSGLRSSGDAAAAGRDLRRLPARAVAVAGAAGRRPASARPGDRRSHLCRLRRRRFGADSLNPLAFALSGRPAGRQLAVRPSRSLPGARAGFLSSRAMKPKPRNSSYLSQTPVSRGAALDEVLSAPCSFSYLSWGHFSSSALGASADSIASAWTRRRREVARAPHTRRRNRLRRRSSFASRRHTSARNF